MSISLFTVIMIMWFALGEGELFFFFLMHVTLILQYYCSVLQETVHLNWKRSTENDVWWIRGVGGGDKEKRNK